MTRNPLERLHVLVVEDNPNMRTVIKTILQGLGVGKISLAHDGADGLQALHSEPIDIVFCDLEMEVLDGLEMVRMVRSAKDSPNPYVPIIVLTGNVTTADVAAARDAGATEFLAKPVSPEALWSRIRCVINHPRAFIKAKKYVGPDRRRRENETSFAADRRAPEVEGPDDSYCAEALSPERVEALLNGGQE